jgi:hypothetical protein
VRGTRKGGRCFGALACRNPGTRSAHTGRKMRRNTGRNTRRAGHQQVGIQAQTCLERGGGRERARRKRRRVGRTVRSHARARARAHAVTHSLTLSLTHTYAGTVTALRQLRQLRHLVKLDEGENVQFGVDVGKVLLVPGIGVGEGTNVLESACVKG